MRSQRKDLGIGVIAAAMLACGSAWGTERERNYRTEEDGDLFDWFDDDDDTKFTPEWEAWDWDAYDYDYDAYQDPYVYEDYKEGPLAYDRYGYDLYDPDVYGADPSGYIGRQHGQPRGYWGSQERNFEHGGSEPSWKGYGGKTPSPGGGAVTRIRGEVRELERVKQSRYGPMRLMALVRTDGGYFRRVSLGVRDHVPDINVGDTIVVVGRFRPTQGLPTIVADRVKNEGRQ